MADERAENQRLFIEFSKRGQIDNMEMMLGEDGVSVNGKDSLGCTALHWAASAGHVEAIKWLLANKANPNAQNNQGETPLHKAAWRNFVEACTFLVKGGAERRLLNKDERAAYSYARSDECRRVCAPEQSAGATTNALQRALEEAATMEGGDDADSGDDEKEREKWDD
ncbi:Osteoclast-stimulating factor 1 [Balamuthia mandrillaris]